MELNEALGPEGETGLGDIRKRFLHKRLGLETFSVHLLGFRAETACDDLDLVLAEKGFEWKSCFESACFPCMKKVSEPCMKKVWELSRLLVSEP